MNSAPASSRHYLSFQAALPGLILLALIFLTNFISRIIFAPFLPVIENDLGISHTDSGSFFLLISAGYFISILSSGFISSQISHKYTIVLSTIASGVILCLLSLCDSLLGLRTGLFCLGLSAGLYLPSGLASIAVLVSPGHLARGMAVHELAPNIGFVIVPLISTLLLSWWSWSDSLMIIGIVLISVGFIYAVASASPRIYGNRPDLISFRKILSSWEFWSLTILFSLAICTTLGLYTMLPLFLVADRNIDLTEANAIVALSRVSSVIMPLVGGWAGDRFGHRMVMLSVLIGSGLLTVPMGFVNGNVLLFFIFLQPMLGVCFFPSGFSILASTKLSPEASMVVSLCIPIAFLTGGGGIPAIIGFVGDHHSLALGFTLAGIATSLGGMLIALYWTQGRKNTSVSS